ncbi:hypothetical protein F444_19365 [Phytophthora nicotianae P1976]|uniref:MULE transposase domain-containing protein n=1 Tax=Phytophthora nicotianae P1976 TaxID=1317066 RepID=A0A080Z830_PHYNI|nr:hypothetical protein F444_19365 [Phytophthora nicotianae P1976]
MKMHPDRAVTAMPRDKAIIFISYVRRQANGGDMFRQNERSPYVNVSELDERLFLQFNMFYNNNGNAQRIVGLGHPDLIRLLKIRGVSLFIDATYSFSPAPFKQTLIVMGHDSKFEVYLPVLYILLERKVEMTYTTVLHRIKMLTGMKLSPGSVTCDFETALIN